MLEMLKCYVWEDLYLPFYNGISKGVVMGVSSYFTSVAEDGVQRRPVKITFIYRGKSAGMKRHKERSLRDRTTFHV